MKIRMFSIYIGACISSLAMGYDLPNDNDFDGDSSQLEHLEELSEAFVSLADFTRKSLVFVSVSKRIMGKPLGTIDPFDFFRNPQNFSADGTQVEPFKKFGLGSGFFIDKQQGYILTNFHVVKGAMNITVKAHDGNVYDAKVVGKDLHTDLAVLKVESKGFKPSSVENLVFRKSKETKVGEIVFVFGAPFGLTSSLSFGVISATGRGNLKITRIGDFLQTDAAINPGNSGGPLIGTKGTIVGVNTAIYTRSGGSAGIGFAIPADLAKDVALQLIEHGQVSRGFLGVQTQKLDPELREILELKPNINGVIIQEIADNSPAAAAKFEAGDIITKFAGVDVEDENQFTQLVHSQKAGSVAEVYYYRNDKMQKKRIRLDSWPDESYFEAQEKAAAGNSVNFGLSVKVVSSEMVRNFSLKSRSGVRVVNIKEGSKAQQAGLKVGDIITKVNEERIKSVKQLKHILKKSKKSLVLVERDREFFFVPLQL